MPIKYVYIPLILLVFAIVTFQPNTNQNSIQLKTEQTEFIAGDNIVLEFESNSTENTILYCSNSYGSLLIDPIVEGNNLKFEIPKSVSDKSGIVNWKLLNENNSLKGSLIVKPQPTIKRIESYLGPPSIEAGGTDYSMLVVIPTDALDNPLIDSTRVNVNHQFLEKEVVDQIFTKHGIAYKNIYSYEKNGRILVSSSCLGLNSKEFDINVMPAIPTNFTITADRIHSYADGNQITSFKTSEIRDKYGNIVSDGTFVSFFITDKNGNKTTTSGSTINGSATAKMLHPDHEDQWTIKAYIEGMANSNEIVLDYKQAVLDFEVEFSENNRTITVGPLQSFMNQKIPDGLSVTLKIFKNETLEDELLERSYLGYATFILNEDRYPEGDYTFVIETAGLNKTYTQITYE